jgi:hypothetical protein
MKNFLLLLVLSFLCCSPRVVTKEPLGYSYLPPFLDLDTVGPNIPASLNPSNDPKLQDYPPIAIMAGKYILTPKDTVTLPFGTLFSNMRTAKYVFYASEYERLNTQLKYSKYLMLDYFNKGKAAEVRYQEEIVALRKSNQRSWLEQNIGYLGVGAGIITAVLTEWAVLHTGK